jgi:hypothetical protein
MVGRVLCVEGEETAAASHRRFQGRVSVVRGL